MMGGLLGLTALIPATSFAQVEIEIFDDRKAKKGNDRLIEAMDETLSQAQREGIVESKSDLDRTKKRLVASKDLLKANVRPKLDQNVWWEATSSLRAELGSLRRDITTVAETLPRQQRRVAFKSKKDFYKKIEAFDRACGQGIKPETADRD